MGSGARTYKPSFIKTGSGIHMLKREIHRQHDDSISPTYFLKIKEIGQGS
jgi:hypothetical protein